MTISSITIDRFKDNGNMVSRADKGARAAIQRLFSMLIYFGMLFRNKIICLQQAKSVNLVAKSVNLQERGAEYPSNLPSNSSDGNHPKCARKLRENDRALR